MAGSVLCAALLHLAGERSDAVWLLPVIVAWGARAILGPLPPTSAGLLLLAALLVRLPLVGTPLHLSDDLFRYLWEGTALSHGHNVFLQPPASLPGLDDALRARVNHPEVPSVYPPLALWWFRWLSLWGTPGSVQFFTALADASVPLALWRLGRTQQAPWIYALHPLPALESASGGHLDLVAVALAAAGLVALQQRQRGAGFLLTVGGALMKLLPLAWLPVVLRSQRPGQALSWSVLALLAALALSWPVLDDDPALLVGWRAYAGRWEFNGLLYPWLRPWLGGATRPALVSLAGLAVLAVWLRVRDPVRAWQIVGTVFVCTSPTVHPWYVVWALAPSLAAGSLGWAWASLPLMGSYAVLTAFDPATGQWSETPWLWWITWPPALGALGLCAWREGQRENSEARPTAA